MISLATAVYTAGHGYAWSSAPAEIDEDVREQLLADALSMRTDFPEDDTVDSGVVVRHGLAAAFTIRRVKAWDAEGRDADYAAFAFLDCARADAVDFAALLADAFFCTPLHTPPVSLAYSGPASARPRLDAPGRLLCQNRLEDFDPHAIGALLTAHALHSDSWKFTFTDGTCSVTTSPWHR